MYKYRVEKILRKIPSGVRRGAFRVVRPRPMENLAKSLDSNSVCASSTAHVALTVTFAWPCDNTKHKVKAHTKKVRQSRIMNHLESALSSTNSVDFLTYHNSVKEPTKIRLYRLNFLLISSYRFSKFDRSKAMLRIQVFVRGMSDAFRIKYSNSGYDSR